MRAAAPKLSAMAKAAAQLLRISSSAKPVPTPKLPRHSMHLVRLYCSDDTSDLRDRIQLLTEKPPATATLTPNTRADIDALAAAVLSSSVSDQHDPSPELDSLGAVGLLLRSHPAASLSLLSRLRHRPLLALHVFSWRRRLPEPPLLPEELAKAIALAGRARLPDLAASLFSSHSSQRTASLYNALMSAYLINGLPDRTLALFDALRRDPDTSPTVATFNILLSLFGRSMLIDHMEAALRALRDAELTPTLITYNNIIAGYLTAWNWDKMDSTFQLMRAGSVQPEPSTLFLMLRGYAYSGNLDKMEEMYELVKEQVNDHEAPLLRAMICAYCKSSDPDRVRKIEELSKYIPQDEYRPWLNVLLIKVYAQEGLVEVMERFISEAFNRNTTVRTLGVMKSIISNYFRCDAVDQLAGFVRQAEDAGWRLCRSLYHCMMVMYGRHNRMEEMHGVLEEMEMTRFVRTKKTFLIMYKAYSDIGRRLEAESVIGMMWKNGFVSPEDAFLS